MPRIDKCGQRIGFEAPRDGSEGDNEVRYIGIDVGKEQHAIAVMDDSGEVVLKPKKFAEDIDGYERLRRWVGEPEEALIGLEATGHYWKNLATTLLGWGFALVLIISYAFNGDAERHALSRIRQREWYNGLSHSGFAMQSSNASNKT